MSYEEYTRGSLLEVCRSQVHPRNFGSQGQLYVMPRATAARVRSNHVRERRGCALLLQLQAVKEELCL